MFLSKFRPTYRGANEYRPDLVPGAPLTQGPKSNRAANHGYVNYINLNAFVLPPIQDASAQLSEPLRQSARATRLAPRRCFNETDLDVNKSSTRPSKP